MTEFELAYMVNETFDTIYVVFQFWVYMTFGVIVGAYFVRGELPHSMLHLAALLYVAIATACIAEIFIFSGDIELLGARLATLRIDGGIPASGWFSTGIFALMSELDHWVSSAAMVIGTLGAIYHLYFTARKGASDLT